MTKWTYGKEGAAHPVEWGQVWRCGRHTFVCSDLMASDLYRDVVANGERPSLVYSDPPWGQGLANGFRTKAGLDRATYSYIDIYARIAELAREYSVPMYLECGFRERAAVGQAMAATDPQTQDIFDITYNLDGTPCVLHYAGPVPCPVPRSEIDGIDDAFTPKIAMSFHDTSGLVLDPCGGIGYTATNAEEAGWSSLLNELHPNRVSVALERVRKMTGEKPERLA